MTNSNEHGIMLTMRLRNIKTTYPDINNPKGTGILGPMIWGTKIEKTDSGLKLKWGPDLSFDIPNIEGIKYDISKNGYAGPIKYKQVFKWKIPVPDFTEGPSNRPINEGDQLLVRATDPDPKKRLADIKKFEKVIDSLLTVVNSVTSELIKDVPRYTDKEFKALKKLSKAPKL